MQQYFENRTLKKYKDIDPENTKEDSIVFANQRVDEEWQSKNYKINNSTFAKMGFLKSKFSNDDLRFNVFLDCYFKRTRFENVNFTGSVFINCNFDKAVFVNCTFDYCRFDDCFIKYEDFVQSLSNRANIRWELCKNLSLECLKLGHEEEFRKYYFAENEAREQYYWKKFWHKGTEEYYRKYNGLDRISGLWNYILSKANKFLWGYGEKLSRLIVNIVYMLIVFAIGYYVCIDEVANNVNMNWGIAFYMSLSNFFTVTCDYTPEGFAYKVLSVAEGGIGIVSMGFFVAALFRYINRRG